MTYFAHKDIESSNPSFVRTGMFRTWFAAVCLCIGYLILQAGSALAKPIVLDFEDLPVTRNSVLLAQYADRGVTFNSPYILNYAGTFAHSGSKALEPCYGHEFCYWPLAMDFTAPQKRVKVWVGSRYPLDQAKTVVLRVFHGNMLLASSQATIPPNANPTPVNTPLLVQVQESTITRAEVRFWPETVPNDIVVDDVEFDQAGPPPTCTATSIPVITLAPPPDEPLQFNVFTLNGAISTESPLYSVSVKVTGSGGSRTSDLAVGLDVPSNGGALPMWQYHGLLYSGANTITVEATNCKGTGTAILQVTFAPILAGTRLVMTALDVTQAVHDANKNALRRAAAKQTVARVYLRVDGPTSEIRHMGGSLVASRTFGPSLFTGSITSLNEITVSSSSDDAPQRRDVNLTVNFILPPDWIRAGNLTLKFVPRIGGDPGVLNLPCDGCANETAAGQPREYPFVAVPPMSILSVPITFPDGSSPAASALIDTFNYIADTYPIADLRVTPSPTGLTIPSSVSLDCFTVLSHLQANFSLADSPRSFIYGVMPRGLGCSGMAPQLFSWYAIGHGVVNNNRGWVAAEEIGHDLGRCHASCAHGEGGFCQGAFDDCPEPWPYEDGGTGSEKDVGFSTVQMIAIPASGPYPSWPPCSPGGTEYCKYNDYRAHDIMDPLGGAPVWISDVTWEAIFSRLLALSPELAPPLPPDISEKRQYLLVRGKLEPGGQIKMLPLYKAAIAPRPSRRVEGGSYTIELQGTEGQSLLTQYFEPTLYTHSNDLGFTELVPFVKGAQRLVVWRQNAAGREPLAKVVFAGKRPTVQLSAPKGGDRWPVAGRKVITWKAIDQPLKKLNYAVQYSRDGGQHWLPLGLDVRGGALSVDVSRLAGSEHAMIRLLATDGANTTEVRSKVFSVANKHPVVAINVSGGERSFPVGEAIWLEAKGWDLEDGFLGDNTFEWIRDRNVPLGSGRSIQIDGLEPGDHTISVVVRDTGGALSRATKKIHVRPVVPLADVRLDQSCRVGTPILLDGRGSRGVGRLNFTWTIVEGPRAARAELSNNHDATPYFRTNVPGDYVIELKVRDTIGSGSAVRVSIAVNK